ncbi:exodeoxyribonuclease V subunit alpha [Vibrio sp. SS-MA-C1-2]|uniref:exodeoxyribonuclease V subunit alpha n=1 Tax=Vibrio sp. SS-MA-C1-2 TaxID=2908646 RepID=UPI001F2B6810|nr:exodeoxyribonuclease V subunit alpha [Vibrio sp. SS-MA-C1-2]UJF18925.1 exodeoxyribonuclease V subunit alpha [Vibrio sp. SS-MA-C1-2]
MRELIKLWHQYQMIRPLDYQFSQFIAQTVENESKKNRDIVALCSMLVSVELGGGHVCLELANLLQHPLLQPVALDRLAEQDGLFANDCSDINESKNGEPAEQINPLKQQLNYLAYDDLIACLTSSAAVSDGSQATPLVLRAGKLYLYRYWLYEQQVAEKLNSMSQPQTITASARARLDQLFARQYNYLLSALERSVKDAEPDITTEKVALSHQAIVCDLLDITQPDAIDWQAVNQALLAAETASDLAVLDQLIPLEYCLNWQKTAAAVALSRQFSVISGGPGTGKTTTVAKLLAALVTQAEEQHQRLLIKLVAPTGKAAARLTESIGSAIHSLAIDDEIKQLIPTQASTLHRLLGAIPGQVDFRHNQHNPLHLDLLIVDEASMIDLPMMTRLLLAMPSDAKLILLGDRDQLASVEAGAVLGDICAFIAESYSLEQRKTLQQLTGFNYDDSIEQQQKKSPTLKQPEGSLTSLTENAAIRDSLCLLRKSYRFHANSGVGSLARAINSGRVSEVKRVWLQGFKDIELHPLSDENYQQLLIQAADLYQNYLTLIQQQAQPAAILKSFAEQRVLCAVREGDFGVDGINHKVEKELIKRKLIERDPATWYQGRPIMITKNDHGLGLYNGDIGITFLDPNTQRLRVFFDLPDGSIRAVLPSRLPEHQTVFAMTIHKSQGSEFDNTLMLLPPTYLPVITRELIYTGVTRAKFRLDLYGHQPVIERGVKNQTQRASGLVELLI